MKGFERLYTMQTHGKGDSLFPIFTPIHDLVALELDNSGLWPLCLLN